MRKEENPKHQINEISRLTVDVQWPQQYVHSKPTVSGFALLHVQHMNLIHLSVHLRTITLHKQTDKQTNKISIVLIWKNYFSWFQNSYETWLSVCGNSLFVCLFVLFVFVSVSVLFCLWKLRDKMKERKSLLGLVMSSRAIETRFRSPPLNPRLIPLFFAAFPVYPKKLSFTAVNPKLFNKASTFPKQIVISAKDWWLIEWYDDLLRKATDSFFLFFSRHFSWKFQFCSKHQCFFRSHGSHENIILSYITCQVPKFSVELQTKVIK